MCRCLWFVSAREWRFKRCHWQSVWLVANQWHYNNASYLISRSKKHPFHLHTSFCLYHSSQDTTQSDTDSGREMGRGGSLEWKQDECMQVIASLCFSLSCRGLLNVSITFSFDAANKWKTSMVIRAYEYVEMPEQLWKNCPFGRNSTVHVVKVSSMLRPNATWTWLERAVVVCEEWGRPMTVVVQSCGFPAMWITISLELR